MSSNVHGTRIMAKTQSVATDTAHKLKFDESGELAGREWRRMHGAHTFARGPFADR
jgi:hypothetical protein